MSKTLREMAEQAAHAHFGITEDEGATMLYRAEVARVADTIERVARQFAERALRAWCIEQNDIVMSETIAAAIGAAERGE